MDIKTCSDKTETRVIKTSKAKFVWTKQNLLHHWQINKNLQSKN